MKAKKRIRGTSLTELTVSAAIALLIGGAVLVVMRQAWFNEDVTAGISAAEWRARRSVDILADSIRNSQRTLVNATPETYACVSAASINSITLFDSAGTTVRYRLNTQSSPGLLDKTIGNNAPSTMLTGVQALRFIYYKTTSYTAPSNTWATTTNPNAPTSAELPYIGAVSIEADVIVSLQSSYTRQLSTLVRLRNSPL